MKVVEFLEANKSSLRSGLPIELLDIIDERGVYSGSYEVLLEQLEKAGLEHVRNARFVMEDTENEDNRIVLLYMKDLEKYDDFDLRQFAFKMKRLECLELSKAQEQVDDIIDNAKARDEEIVGEGNIKSDLIKE